MCDPTGIAVGAAIGAATSAATGNDPLQGAVLGGATGGFSPSSFGATPGLDMIASKGVTVAGTGFTYSGLATATAVGLGAGYAQKQLFAQPEFPTYDTPYQTAQVQQFNSQQIDTTGSGGRQAAASLAEAIQRSRQRKLSQEDVGDLSIDTSAFASTGLQLA
jgi:hypothetical protein